MAAECVGLSQRAMQCAIDYAKQRTAFGKTISENQGVSFYDLQKWLEILRHHVFGLKAACEVDEGEKTPILLP